MGPVEAARPRPSLLETVVEVIILLHLLNAMHGLVTYGPGSKLVYLLFSLCAWSLTLVRIITSLAPDVPGYLASLLRLSWAQVLLAFCAGSLAWSQRKINTGLDVFFLIFNVLYLTHLFRRYTLEQTLSLARLAIGVSVILGVLLYLAVPSWAITVTSPNPFSGSSVGFNGTYHQKNPFGQAMNVGLILTLLLSFLQPRAIGKTLGYGLLFSGFLLASNSRGSLLTTVLEILGIAFVWMLIHFRGGFRLFFGTTAIAILTSATLFVALNLSGIFQALGKDVTLTGRVPLWESCMRKIALRPMLGYGFNSFWPSRGSPQPPYEEMEQVQAEVGWLTPNGHNGLIDLTLNLGLIGVVIVGIFVLRTAWLILRCARGPDADARRSQVMVLSGLWFLSLFPHAIEATFLLPRLFCGLLIFFTYFHARALNDSLKAPSVRSA